MTALRILVKVGNNIVPVEFGWDLIYPNSGIRGCSFSTEDVELQKALESHEYFNRELQPSFWTDDVEEVEEGKDDTVKEFPDVTTMADARKVLKEIFGKSSKETKTNEQVLALANELNIKFPNLK